MGGDGREVQASRYEVSDTWADFLLWGNRESSRLMMVSTTYEWAARVYGDHVPIVVLAPECEAKDVPVVRVMARLESSPLDSARCGSALVCVWFQESASRIPDEIGAAALEKVNWEKQADDFDL